jgi:flagellar motor protein MotB
MLAQLERQFLQADLAQARQLLADGQAHDDPIAEHQYGQRVARLERELAESSQSAEQTPAGVALFFGGRPVVGSHGIKAAFGTQAVGQFQKLVSQRYAAAETGPLASRGRVPMSEDTQLLVTDVVRGSFGFVLQASEPANGDAVLKQVVDEVADTLSRMAASDDALFDEASAGVDNRQLGALKEFFKLLDDEGASLRVVEGERDFELTTQAVQRARRRAEGLVIEDRSEVVQGQVIGWAEHSMRFELRMHVDRSVVTGAVARDAMERLLQEGLNPLHLHVRAAVDVREVRRRSRTPHKSYNLQSIEVIAAPEDWPTRPVQHSM